MRVPLLAIWLAGIHSVFPATAVSQEEKPSTSDQRPPPLEDQVKIWRGEMKNPVTDPVALLALTRANGGKKPDTLKSAVAAWFPKAGAGICWDTNTCRVICAWRGDGFLEIDEESGISRPVGESVGVLAEGPIHVSPAIGAYLHPKYFGFRIHEPDGAPEFLYSSGRLAVSERFSFSEDGQSLHQHFTIENPPADVTLVFPESFEKRISSSKGTLKRRFLTVSKADAARFTVTYDLRSEGKSNE